ncbi:aminoglycoside phosphotransferase family protein [Amycolatopsis sp. NPDC049688]|uniref:phosphotransferase family protein n=1 Tax=Amycolatopsis sp. NPDC049688 TaxID=3154733 RepID=UPI003444EB73
MPPPLEKACAAAGVDGRGARLIQARVNVVYELPYAGAVARLHHLDHPKWQDRLRTVVEVTRWLAGRDFPTIVPLDVAQPVAADGWTATFWRLEQVDATARQTGLLDLAPVLRRLHTLPAPPFEVPPTQPAGSLPADVERDRLLPDDQRAWLLAQIAEITERYPVTEMPLGHGLVHGDAHPGNLFLAGGRFLLGDWDSVSHGPVAQDLIPILDDVLRFGRPRSDWTEYCAAYGADPGIAEQPGMQLLQRVRELRLLAPCIRGAAREEIRAELDKRLRTLMTGSNEVWRSLQEITA